MQKFTYPTSDLDRAKRLLRVLGSFWANTYEAKDQLRAFTAAIAEGVKQSVHNLTETVDAISRHDLPVLHTENWYPITVKKSQLNLTAANNYKFDNDNMVFDGQPVITFDAIKRINFYAAPIPENLAEVSELYDRVLFPTISLIANVDFLVDRRDKVIVFTQNPFLIPEISSTAIYENGEIVDESITLWAFKAKFDHQYLFKQFAYAVNARLKSTENAKKFLNAIFDGLLAAGAGAAVLDAALSALFDVPLAENDGETVELIELDNRGLIVATDKSVYRFAGSATPVVGVNQKLRAGDRLINAFEIVDLNRGSVPDTVTALALDSGFTSGCFYSDLIFENKELPIQVDVNHPTGFTYISFPVGGFPADVQKFFDEMHARGIMSLEIPVEEGCQPPPARTGTLANVLDLRTNPIGQPTADDLPGTINPLKFIVENVLRNNTTVVIVRISELGKNHLGLYNIRHIRQLLPPHMALIFTYIIDGKSDTVDSAEAMPENLGVFTATAPLTDSVPDVLINDRGVIVRVISGSCQ